MAALPAAATRLTWGCAKGVCLSNFISIYQSI